MFRNTAIDSSPALAASRRSPGSPLNIAGTHRISPWIPNASRNNPAYTIRTLRVRVYADLILRHSREIVPANLPHCSIISPEFGCLHNMFMVSEPCLFASGLVKCCRVNMRARRPMYRLVSCYGSTGTPIPDCLSTEKENTGHSSVIDRERRTYGYGYSNGGRYAAPCNMRGILTTSPVSREWEGKWWPTFFGNTFSSWEELALF